MKHKIFFLNEPAVNSPSTLLIPAKFLADFEMKVAKFGTKENLFHFIVNTRHPEYRQRPRPGTGKILYQSAGMDLQRVNFMPSPVDWEIFRTYACLRKVSMTLLFVMILMFWDEFELESIIVPEIYEQIKIIQTLNIGKAYSYLELEHLIL